MEKEKYYAGVVDNSKSDAPLAFSCNDFVFSFMTSDLERKTFSLQDNGNFVYGKTFSGHKIAVPLTINKYHNKFISGQRFKTSTFIINDTNVQDSSITNFKSILFRGGTLNKLFYCDGIKEDIDKSTDNKIVYTRKNDEINYKFKFGQTICNINIYSAVIGSKGLNGTSLINSDVVMKLEFSEEQNLSTIYEHIEKVKQVLSIMSYRKNVGFDEIKLIHEEFNVSTVLFKEDKSLTNKYYFQNLTFSTLGEKLSKLFELIYNSEDNKYSYDFGFIPKDDNDLYCYDIQKIKSISSALDCEMDFIEIPKSTNEELNNLIKDVKNTVKKHRSGDNALDDKTYINIFNSINHWSLSESERIWTTFGLYEEPMCVFLEDEPTHYKSQIENFVKFRNGITHGRYYTLSQDIVNIAYALSGLIYCCFLKRLGFSDAEINKLSRDCLLK